MLKIKDYMMKRGKVKVVSAILYTRNSKKVINFFNCLILYFFSGKNLQYGSQIKISPPKSVELIDKGEYLLSRDPCRNFQHCLKNSFLIVLNGVLNLYIAFFSNLIFFSV